MKFELAQRLNPGLKLVITMPYVTSGDLELLSLHRIKNRIGGLDVNEQVRRKLVEELVIANDGYRESSGNNWMCLTPSLLESSVEGVNVFLNRHARLVASVTKDKRLQDMARKQVKSIYDKMRGWFSQNYDELLYDMSRRIPYPIVRKMRDRFRLWATENIAIFSEPIGDLIKEAAVDEGLNPDDYKEVEDLWAELKKRE